MPFALDDRLARDSKPLLTLDLCEVRLINDSRWPWLLLVPQRDAVTELFELTPLDQTMLTFEQMTVSAALRRATGALKINVGALGNIVRQLHVHVIARNEGDANWPGPVWGFGQAVPYADGAEQDFKQRFLQALYP
ncbi:diadenosine tetraphosphate (Ap4A) HIT family hydrolase [Rhizobium halophytocola]|uniref:Diadenosine tetraphosphate (Ap4A) HIT family hydrolase n=2 Tax=Rhizobium halophytocola TaxID=735519 RepID=A0ABS4E136_9HYPH|nr:diadenosine tetraphosphate (Ap4A) HIT family hydrolase [Rhizobium halophytocola]